MWRSPRTMTSTEGSVRSSSVCRQHIADRHQTIFAIDRGALNKCLLDFLEQMPNVRFFFNHKLTGADFTRKTAWFEDRTKPLTAERYPEVEVNFDFMIGADGAHSAVRYHMMKFTRMEYHQEYIDTLWCEFQIGPREGQPGDPFSKFAMPPNYLHIWPAKEFMFIAIPSVVRSPPDSSGYRAPDLTFLGRLIHLHSVPARCAFRRLGGPESVTGLL